MRLEPEAEILIASATCPAPFITGTARRKCPLRTSPVIHRVAVFSDLGQDGLEVVEVTDSRIGEPIQRDAPESGFAVILIELCQHRLAQAGGPRWRTPTETLEEHLRSIQQGSVATTP